jgi:signal peptidase I
VIAALVTILAAAVPAVWWLRRQLLVVTVDGISMQPTYSPGDRLLVRRVRPGAIRRGQVVVVAKSGPGDDELIVKRAAALPGDPVPAGIPVPDRMVPAGRLVVLGDNPAASYDSRAMGYVAARALIGVVLRPVS